VDAPGMLTATGAAHTEVIAWCDAGLPDALADAGAWLRALAGEEARALRGWADFADAAAAAFRGVDAAEPARRAAAAAAQTGDRRLGERVRSIAL